MVLAVAIVAVALAFHSLQRPQEKRIGESQSTQNTTTSINARSAQQPSQTPPQLPAPTTSQPSASTNQPNSDREAENVHVQRWIEIFTGVLAAVAVLQLVVMFLTLLIYRRQAYEMRRQRQEMRRQRHVMYSQWKAMRSQLSEMGEQTKVLKDSVAHAATSAESAQHTVEMMRLDQRAWVGATKIRITDFHPGKTVKVMIRLRNSGKSLAFNVTADKYVDPWLNTKRSHWSASGANHPDITLFPNGDFWFAGRQRHRYFLR